MSSDEMQNYSGTWEHEYYGQLHQPAIVYRTPFSDDDRNKLLIPGGDHVRTSTTNAAVNVSGPETGANPIVSGKPTNKRRRSTAGTSSSPTTFLNASITNFRALVQQHTSRSSGGGNNGSISTSRKGPITLCFDSSSSISSTLNHHHHHHEPSSLMPNISSTQAHHRNYYPN